MFLVTLINDPEAILHAQRLLIALERQVCKSRLIVRILYLSIRKALRDLIYADILLWLRVQTSLGQVETLLLLPRMVRQAPPDVVDTPLLCEGPVALHCHLVTLFLTAELVNQTNIDTKGWESQC